MTSTVRDLTPDELDKYKDKLRHNLKLFHNFCETQDLTYYLSDGTLLGAIRHQGMIPWDDDIDVCMPRTDYSKLESLSHLLPPELLLTSVNSTQNYPFPYIKICSAEKDYCEVIGDTLHPTGAWIDVFPLDGTYRNKTAREIHYLLTKLARTGFNLKSSGNSIIQTLKPTPHVKLKRILLTTISVLIKPIPIKTLYWLMDYTARHKNFEKSLIVGNLYTGIGTRASHDKSIFKSKIPQPFDELSFYVPLGFHQYLKNLYGEYLTPPPPNKRRTQHNIKISKN